MAAMVCKGLKCATLGGAARESESAHYIPCTSRSCCMLSDMPYQLPYRRPRFLIKHMPESPSRSTLHLQYRCEQRLPCIRHIGAGISAISWHFGRAAECDACGRRWSESTWPQSGAVHAVTSVATRGMPVVFHTKEASHEVSVKVMWAVRRSARGGRPVMAAAIELQDLPDDVLNQIALGLESRDSCATC